MLKRGPAENKIRKLIKTRPIRHKINQPRLRTSDQEQNVESETTSHRGAEWIKLANILRNIQTREFPIDENPTKTPKPEVQRGNPRNT